MPIAKPTPISADSLTRANSTAGNHDLLPPREQLAQIDNRINDHLSRDLPRLNMFWDYYRNPVLPSSQTTSNYRPGLAQSRGLPDRLTQTCPSAPRRELVIENDIAWRINALADFMFAKPAVIQSKASDKTRANEITALLNQTINNSGGVAMFQTMALLASIYGYVDVLVNLDTRKRAITLEPVEAPRVIPILNENDYRQLNAYALHHRRSTPRNDGGILQRLMYQHHRRAQRPNECTQLFTDRAIMRFNGRPHRKSLVEIEPNPFGTIPVVHIQNIGQPYRYEGLSEVEPLIPLQNELNTRLSDRANRVTFQSFKMYLGKGLENFLDRPVGPGQMWSTSNPDASIDTFGGDTDSPSETAHINELRDAMDKTSSVSAVAAGLIRTKVGNLTSENALRLVMMGMLAKTEKKRVTFGIGISQICELILRAADIAGLYPNSPDERQIRIDWPSPIPENETERLRNALMKQQLGVPNDQLLAELGYHDCIDDAHAARNSNEQTQAD